MTTTERPTGTCQQCGNTFHPSRRESLVGFARRKFCSQTCNGAAKRAHHAPTDTKACANCGHTLVRRRGEGPAALAKRRFCSRTCANADGRPQVIRKYTPPSKPRRPKPAPGLTVFGDRPPAEPWRPAAWRTP